MSRAFYWLKRHKKISLVDEHGGLKEKGKQTMHTVATTVRNDKPKPLSTVGRELVRSLSTFFKGGFWFCDDCRMACERKESDHGQPACCSECGSLRISYVEPIDKALAIPEGEIIHPGEL